MANVWLGHNTPTASRVNQPTNTAGQTCHMQNNTQMHHCIMNSLTNDGQLKILAECNRYHHNGNPLNQMPSSTLLFKLLMQKAIINTRATTSLLHKKLLSLDTYMAMVNSNIEEFNKYIKMNYKGLTPCSESCIDLMVKLFKYTKVQATANL